MPKSKLFLKQIVVFALIVVTLTACSLIKRPQPPKPQPIPTGVQTTPAKNITEQLARQSQIRKFADYDELKEFLEENSSGVSGGYGGEVKMMKSMDAVVSPMIREESFELGSVAQDTGSDDFSTTNVQVKGVDEADIIKTDGKYVYAVSKNELFIIDGYPAKNAKILSKIVFKSTPQNIYINGNNLIVYGADSMISTKPFFEKISSRRRNNSYTFFKVFDISNKKSPKQVRDLDFEGNYTNSRMIGDYVYFVTTTYNYYLDEDIVIPRIIEDGEVLSTDRTAECRNCPNVYYFDIPYQQYHFTSIAAINITDNDEAFNNEIYLLSSNQNMYVSKNNIYLTYTKHINKQLLAMEVLKEIVFPKLSQKNQDKINKIEVTENFILSQQEKLSKIGIILSRYSESLENEEQQKLEQELEKKMKQKYEDISKELEKTVVHKIAINKGELQYQNFGEVTGQVLNQFSMDENNGYFRIATTKNRSWSQFAEDGAQESYSNLYVLDKNLKLVGSVEKLAEGERIYSVRFMQNRAYMVTFRQTDPLFVIDLKEPTNPKVLGELKIPGFSNYLHPYDNDTLIGLGRDADEDGRTKGVKLSLFDVSDVSNPTEIDTYIIGKDRSANSIALNDHKAFLFSLDKNLLVIPISKKEEVSIIEQDFEIQCFGEDCVLPLQKPRQDKYFRGAMIFNIDKDGFTLKGEIDHSDGLEDASRWWYGYNYYDTTVKRSLYIDDVLYTFSNKYLKMHGLDSLEEVESLELEDSEDDFKVVN